MDLVQIGNKIINLDQIKYVEKYNAGSRVFFGEETEETRFTTVVRLDQNQSDRFLAYLEDKIERIP